MKFRLLIVALVCLTSVVGTLSGDFRDSVRSEVGRKLWNSFKAKYLRNYTDQTEDVFRFKIFLQRLKEVSEHDEQSQGFKVSLNLFADRTREELETLNGLKQGPIQKVYHKDLQLNLGDRKNAPDSFNWADFDGVVGPAKFQGFCGSCWAFATTGLLEGQERLNKTGYPVALSEQQLVDCDSGSDGCAGGFMTTALNYVARNGGLQTSSDYPYWSGWFGHQFKCSHKRSAAFHTTTGKLQPKILKFQDEEEMKQFLFEYGPIAVAIDASSSKFSLYRSGVFFDPKCSNTMVNHAVLLVGYGTSKGEDYWIIKNSWSKFWGQNGYGWIARNRAGHCGILHMPTISVS